MSELVVNPQDPFSQNEAHIDIVLCYWGGKGGCHKASCSQKSNKNETIHLLVMCGCIPSKAKNGSESVS